MSTCSEKVSLVGDHGGMTETADSRLVELFDVAQSRDGRPGARPVLETERAKVVVFEFAEGDTFPDHAARHPILVHVARGRIAFTLPSGTVELSPGNLLHVEPMVRHELKALEPATLTVTMLLPHSESAPNS